MGERDSALNLVQVRTPKRRKETVSHSVDKRAHSDDTKLKHTGVGSIQPWTLGSSSNILHPGNLPLIQWSQG